MADETRPPVAIRSMRPYSSEDAFLAEERDTLTRTAITLIGAPSRPRGVVIRFEVTLIDGSPILRGEGRVLGFQAADDQGPSSLTLRFTKLDARSKALVDRAAELREADKRRAASEEAPSLEVQVDTEPPPGDTPLTGTPSTPPPSGDPLAATSMGFAMPNPSDFPPASSEEAIALAISSGSLPLGEVEEIGVLGTFPPPAMVARVASSPPPVRLSAPPPSDSLVAAAVPDPAKEFPPAPPHAEQVEVPRVAVAVPLEETARRDGLLDRLRTRAKTLSPTQVARILAVPRPTD